jgi:hypothetical protein
MKAIVPEFLSKNSLYEELDYVEVPQQEDKKFKVV